MESNNLTTRTYTTPTCTLIVASQDKQVSRLDRTPKNQPIDFILHIDDPDRGDMGDCITLQGQPKQLDCLQQVVSKYIAELVAKFPLPATDRPTISEPEPTQPQLELNDPSISDRLYPNRQQPSTQSKLSENLPGLRNITSSPSPNQATPKPKATNKPSISMFFLGRWNKHQDRQNDTLKPNSPANATTPVSPDSERSPGTPYLTGSDRSLDRYLHLGDLATTASGEVLTLSVIQLFDLATVLDEYVTADVTTPVPAPTHHVYRPIEPETVAIAPEAVPAGTSLSSRLPNLPRIPATPTTSQVYDRTQGSRSSSFVSAMPWAVAAAVAVGVPLLLLDPNPNPVKDIASKVKVPDLTGAKKSVTALLPQEKSTKPTDRSSSAESKPTTALPQPWQAQPVQPPVSPKPLDTGVQTAQTTSKIGIAPLPSAIAGSPGQSLPTTTAPAGGKIGTGVVSSILPRDGAKSGVAPNPLSSQVPSDPGIDSITGLPTSSSTPTSIAKSSVTAPSQTRSIATATAPVVPNTTTTTPVVPTKTTVAKTGTPIAKAKSAGKESNRIPNSALIDPGTISISKQPISMPPTDLPTLPNLQPIPFNPTPISVSEQKKVAKQKAKPTAVASKPKPKTVNPTGIAVAPQPVFEPFTPVPKNPNLINPEENNPAAAEPQNPPIVPDRPLQSNSGAGFGADPVDTPSLQETKRYFQSKWKANTNQPNSLQYVVQVGGKSGIVKNISPQGEAATTYLQQTKFIKTGQKLISPAAAGNSDQKIRVLLEPDGNVDTFAEP